MQDEVVKVSPHARASRDVEDEELRSFFCGMSPWQVKRSRKSHGSLQYLYCQKNCKEEIDLVFSEMLQFILIVAASSVGEELFYRAAVQVGFYFSITLVCFAEAIENQCNT